MTPVAPLRQAALPAATRCHLLAAALEAPQSGASFFEPIRASIS